ncbi:MAG: hypothetical protein ACR2IV_01285 [Bryobacteraceae bacterium]
MVLSLTEFEVDGKATNWLDIVFDGFLLVILFAVWLWQFESSAKGSLYHLILAGLGLVCLVAVGVLVAATLVSAVWPRGGS